MPAREDDGVPQVAHANDAVSATVVIIVIVIVLKEQDLFLTNIETEKHDCCLFQPEFWAFQKVG